MSRISHTLHSLHSPRTLHSLHSPRTFRSPELNTTLKAIVDKLSTADDEVSAEYAQRLDEIFIRVLNEANPRFTDDKCDIIFEATSSGGEYWNACSPSHDAITQFNIIYEEDPPMADKWLDNSGFLCTRQVEAGSRVKYEFVIPYESL